MPPPQFLENMVTLCFGRLFSKKNSVIRLKSNILAPQKFWAGLATDPRFAHEFKETFIKLRHFSTMAHVSSLATALFHNLYLVL